VDIRSFVTPKGMDEITLYYLIKLFFRVIKVKKKKIKRGEEMLKQMNSIIWRVLEVT
jgi:hypothetical protein